VGVAWGVRVVKADVAAATRAPVSGVRVYRLGHCGRADLVAVYVDWGVSSGMQAGIDVALALGLSVEHRRLGRAVSSAVVD